MTKYQTVCHAACAGMVLWAAAGEAQNLFVSASQNDIFEITPRGVESVFEPGLAGVNNLAFDSAGDLFAENDGTIIKITPGGVESTFATTTVNTGELAFNSAGNLFMASGTTDEVIEFAPNGTESTFASTYGLANGLAFAVPEPAVWGLLVAGVPAWLFYRRSRKPI
jgi:hypothetical protein